METTGELPVQATNGHLPRRPSRAEIRQRRRIERDEGVPFHLDHDDIDVKVRLLNVAERATLVGLPTEIQQLMLRGFNAEAVLPDAGQRTFEDMLRVIDTEEQTANEVCIAGFISPRLVRSEAEADGLNDPDVWWVQELALNDRKKYLRLVMGQDAAELARIHRFLRNRLAGVEGAGAHGRGGDAEPAFVAAGDAGPGLQPDGLSGL